MNMTKKSQPNPKENRKNKAKVKKGPTKIPPKNK
jgi:hypothetical protein